MTVSGVPNIRVIIREADDENLLVDVPNLSVRVLQDSSYNVNVTPSVVLAFRTGSYNRFADVALLAYTASYVSGSDTAVSASFAVTASYAQTINRQISGSVFITGSTTITDNLTVEGTISAERLLVSSSIIYESGSTKFGDSPEDTHQFTGSVLIDGSISASKGITGSFKGDGSQLTGLVTDLRVSGSIGSDTLSLLTDDLIVTGNNGIITTVTNNTLTIDVPFGLTASLYGTASVADGIDVIFAGVFETGSAGVIIPAPSGGLSYITSASYAFTASYALNGGGGGNIDTSSFATTGSNVFKNNQTVSGSINITNNNVLGDTTTSTLGGTPIALNYGITKGDLANRFSGIKIRNYDWSGGNLAGEVSIWTDSEAQDFSTQRVVVDGFGNVNVTGSLTVTGTTNISGSLYGTSSWASNVISSSFATSASRATTSSFTVSSSFATSSSRAVTSSFALTASFASNASIPAGTLSSSTQVSAFGFATTASNTFNGNQTITGSLLTNADTLVFSGSMYTSGSVSITGSLQATHFILLTTAPTNPETGSMYFSGSFIYVYTGTQYRSASLA